jgi:hypothetical protein
MDGCLATCALFALTRILSGYIEDELRKWLAIFLRACFVFYLPIKPPHLNFLEMYFRQDFLECYLRVVSNVTFYIVYELRPSRIVMPALILLHGIVIYNRFRNPPLQQTQQVTFHPPFGRHCIVDC